MKVLILAGGMGTRISEYTKTIPKPMISIAGKPILIHIMSHYLKYDYKEFFIASGYKNQIIKNYFTKRSLISHKIVNLFRKIKDHNNDRKKS